MKFFRNIIKNRISRLMMVTAYKNLWQINHHLTEVYRIFKQRYLIRALKTLKNR